MPSYQEPAAPSRASRRREREREIIAATRLLFDERGLQDAPIESIARAVGINKALIYRHFSSKEELYVLTLSSYLADLAERLEEVPVELEPVARLEEGWVRYTDFCLEHPAFLDCGLSLTIQLQSPNSKKNYSLPARVIHSTQKGSGDWLVGCQFECPLTSADLDDLL